MNKKKGKPKDMTLGNRMESELVGRIGRLGGSPAVWEARFILIAIIGDAGTTHSEAFDSAKELAQAARKLWDSGIMEILIVLKRCEDRIVVDSADLNTEFDKATEECWGDESFWKRLENRHYWSGWNQQLVKPGCPTPVREGV